MDEVKVWNSVLDSAMALPFVKVKRDEFLKKELAVICNEEQIGNILNGQNCIWDFVTKDQIDKIANGTIRYHLTTVTATSALAGIPGGWAMAGTIPADLAQFFGHVLCLTQKLLYLYGWPDLSEGTGKMTEESLNILTIFIGVTLGSQAADAGIKAALEGLSKGVPAKLGQMAITKTAIYQLARQVAKFLGYKLTRDTFLKGVGKVIPLIGAPISGGITYFTFRPMAFKLKKYLKDNCHK